MIYTNKKVNTIVIIINIGNMMKESGVTILSKELFKNGMNIRL